jgi:multiple sugar transport system substrate-binding protein
VRKLSRRDVVLLPFALRVAPPLALTGAACARKQAAARSRTVVLKHQPLWGDPAPFRALLRRFEEAHGATVVTELLPNASDTLHQYFLTALEARAPEFDVLVVDTIWVHEFARAGWIADLSSAFPPPRVREAFAPGAARTAIFDGKTFAVPWFVDVGLLYYRKDLLDEPPATFAALAEQAARLTRDGACRYGYVFQGRQYEGLVCNVYEAIFAHGGSDLAHAAPALATLRRLLETGIAPPAVTSAAEEESRRLFERGALFMRNWPYAFAEAERVTSPLRGRVGIAPLPWATKPAGDHVASGAPGVLGGFHLAVNAFAPAERRPLAEALVAHLTSVEANVLMATEYARNPARSTAYEAPELVARAPFVATLREHVARARTRPITPHYPMLSDVLANEFSAALTGVRTPDAAVGRAARLIEHLTQGPT